MNTRLIDREFEKYLSLLDIQQHKPSIEALERLVQSHLTKIPFENISKLYYWKTTGRHSLPDLTQYLDGIERYHFGGTCYTNNYFLHRLLSHLGYDVSLCGADMNKPDVHLVNIVKIEGREFVVDAGYAAPFLEPIPRDLNEDYSISLGRDRYVLKPKDFAGRSRLELYRNEELKHGYNINPSPRIMSEFSHVVKASYEREATFMNAVLLVRFGLLSSSVIHNFQYIETQGSSSKIEHLRSSDELVERIFHVFGIPSDVVRIAIDGFSFKSDAWN
jgi:arylamine N-acetyltransferase